MKNIHLLVGAIASLFYLGSTCGFANALSRPKHHFTKKTYISKRKITALTSRKVNNVLFGFNKTSVPSASFPELDHVAKLMTDSNASLKLGGYADNKGGYVYNWKLSQKRAEAVKNYLISKGADSAKIAATEFGYTHPIASNKTASGRQKNRRVEIHFVN